MNMTISADETNNAIIVFGTPRDYAIVDEALRKLDVRPYQVLIEAAITEVTLTDNLRYGVEWNFRSGETSFSLGNSDTPTPSFPGFSFFYSNKDNISGTLNALEKRANIKVISAPKLLVLNNQTAALQVGDQVPITTQSASNLDSANDRIVNSVEYRDTGVILKVTPRVNASGLVLLDIAQEVSDVNENQTSGIDSPTISTRRISTSIAVQDGQVIALGGMFRNAKSYGKNGIPLLSRIPVLGALFGTNTDTENRTELLVILKPHVLRTADDGRAVTEELRAKLRTLEPFRTGGRIP
jgi:general secretion pathway protein D